MNLAFSCSPIPKSRVKILGYTEGKISIDKINEELAFQTNTHDGQIEIIETFRLMLTGNNNTNIIYTTQTNIDGDIAVESILRTHIANILYSLLMLETGYVNGLIEKE